MEVISILPVCFENSIGALILFLIPLSRLSPYIFSASNALSFYQSGSFHKIGTLSSYKRATRISCSSECSVACVPSGLRVFSSFFGFLNSRSASLSASFWIFLRGCYISIRFGFKLVRFDPIRSDPWSFGPLSFSGFFLESFSGLFSS